MKHCSHPQHLEQWRDCQWNPRVFMDIHRKQDIQLCLYSQGPFQETPPVSLSPYSGQTYWWAHQGGKPLHWWSQRGPAAYTKSSCWWYPRHTQTCKVWRAKLRFPRAEGRLKRGFLTETEQQFTHAIFIELYSVFYKLGIQILNKAWTVTLSNWVEK